MAFVKDMLRMWAHSWKRFISIAMITLLGVAVLTGIYAGCRDAFRSTDRFFDAQGLHDVQVLSTAGLSNGDIAALRKVNGVAKVQAERSQEVTFDLDGRKSATMQEIGTNGIDQPYLQEGRMPKKAGEIAVTRKFIRDSGKHIGSRLTVTPESASSDTSDTNDTNGADGTNETNGTDEAPSFPTKLTIVGVVLDPQNLSNPDGYSAMTSFRSTATTDYTFFAPSDGVTGTLYTSATLLVKGTAAESTFDESYENTVKQVTDRIDGTVKTDRQKARRQELLGAGNKKIVDARAEADKKFADAQSQIDANRQQFNQQVDQIVDMQASALGVKAGSKVRLTNGDGVQATAKVSAVNRNLIGSDVYVSETYYAKLFDSKDAKNTKNSKSSEDSEALTWNAMLAKLSGSDTSQTDYAESLEEDSSVMKAVSCAHMADSFKFDLMGAVVALIVALAGGLALVVLFTLANTNVSERVREMATLKVLGFFDREVHRYVNREMMILTVMGVILGLPLGRLVGGMLTMALNMPSLYFEVEVKPLSYVIAAVATMAFALLVQLFVNPVLDRIDPISSLKSVE